MEHVYILTLRYNYCAARYQRAQTEQAQEFWHRCAVLLVEKL